MIGLLVATHGNLADELVRTAEMIIGPLERVRTVGICREDSIDDVRARISEELALLDEGEGVLAMTDMFGGTPSNMTLSFYETGRIEVLTGVNLPMLLKFFNTREGLSLSDLAAMLKSYGQHGIALASDFLEKSL